MSNPATFESITSDDLKNVSSAELEEALSEAFMQALGTGPAITFEISNSHEENALLMQAGSVLPASFREKPSREEIEKFWNIKAIF